MNACGTRNGAIKRQIVLMEVTKGAVQVSGSEQHTAYSSDQMRPRKVARITQGIRLVTNVTKDESKLYCTVFHVEKLELKSEPHPTMSGMKHTLLAKRLMFSQQR